MTTQEVSIFNPIVGIIKPWYWKGSEGVLTLTSIALGCRKLEPRRQLTMGAFEFSYIDQKTKHVALRLFCGFLALILLPLTFTAIIIKTCLMNRQYHMIMALLKKTPMSMPSASGLSLSGTSSQMTPARSADREIAAPLELPIPASLSPIPLPPRGRKFIPRDPSTESPHVLFSIPPFFLSVPSYLNVREFSRLVTTCRSSSRLISHTSYLATTSSAIQEMIDRNRGIDFPAPWDAALHSNRLKVKQLELTNPHLPLSEDLSRYASLFSQLTALTLDLQGVQGGQILLTSIFDHPQLTQLRLINCTNLLGFREFREWTEPCPALLELDIQFNVIDWRFEHTFYSIRHFKSIKKLTLNAIGSLTRIVSELPHLRELVLSSPVDAPIIEAIRKGVENRDSGPLTDLTLRIDFLNEEALKALSELVLFAGTTHLKLTIILPFIDGKKRYHNAVSGLHTLSKISCLKEINFIDTFNDTSAPLVSEVQDFWVDCFNLLGDRITKIRTTNNSILSPQMLKVLSSRSTPIPCREFIYGARGSKCLELDGTVFISFLKNFPHLESLQLTNTKLDFSEMSTVPSLPIKLEKLVLNLCEINPKFLHFLAGNIPPQLRKLSLRYSEGFTEDDLRNILERGSFTHLDLAYTEISAPPIHTIVNYQKSLIELDITSVGISDKMGPRTIIPISEETVSALCDMSCLMSLGIDQGLYRPRKVFRKPQNMIL